MHVSSYFSTTILFTVARSKHCASLISTLFIEQNQQQTQPRIRNNHFGARHIAHNNLYKQQQQCVVLVSTLVSQSVGITDIQLTFDYNYQNTIIN